MKAKKNSVIPLKQGNYCGTLLPSNRTNAPSINFPALLIVRGNGGGISITTMVMGSWLMTKKHDGEKGNVRKPRCRLAFLSSCLHVFCFPPVPTFARLIDSAPRARQLSRRGRGGFRFPIRLDSWHSQQQHYLLGSSRYVPGGSVSSLQGCSTSAAVALTMD